MSNILKEMSNIGIIPVVALDDAKDAAPLAKALIKGGIPCAEVTFRTDAAEETIRIMANEYPEMLVGAGTVLTTEQVDKAVEAGAKFIVSPGLNPKIVKYCVDRDILVIPGCTNPSDVEVAIELGLETVKFFPAEPAGGLPMIKAMSAPYHKMKFMPTGGINESNLKSYLDFSKIIACGGSWMVNKSLIEEGNFEEITRLTRKAVNTMLGYKLKHMAINIGEADLANKLSDDLEAMFGFEKCEGLESILVGGQFELMKSHKYGEKGHIAIGTNYVERAVYHLKSQGVEFIEESAQYDAKGNLALIFIKNDFNGFALHLCKN